MTANDKKKALAILKYGNEGFDTRTIIDNLDEDDFLEIMQEYAEKYHKEQMEKLTTIELEVLLSRVGVKDGKTLTHKEDWDESLKCECDICMGKNICTECNQKTIYYFSNDNKNRCIKCNAIKTTK